MNESDRSAIAAVCAEYGNDPARLMDILRAVQAEYGRVSTEFAAQIAQTLDMALVEVESTVSFYSFFTEKQSGKIPIRLCDDVVDRMQGYDLVLQAFEEQLGIKLGETTSDGLFSLERTACIGMCDQAPAALIGDVVMTRITPSRARQAILELRRTHDPKRIVRRHGDGNNSHALVGSMVRNNVRCAGPVLLSEENRGEAIAKTVALSPVEVIRAVKASRLRGRGGAGFPCGMKWEFARHAKGERKFVICNADEGEPGTFKDRVLLTERPNRLMAGLTIAGYAVGAEEGIIYLRAEYAYLKSFLDDVIQQRREDGLLGKNIGGREGFNFEIRIQLGAGAYICGEETALINSCEGQRGDPRNRPPFPAQEGYLGYPTVVNNVETLCCVAKILEEGAATFCSHGTVQSSGTKLLSISGDVDRPGIYELACGATVKDLLTMSGGSGAQAVLVGGPSGNFVPAADFLRTICYDDLATGGAFVVFGPERDLLEIVEQYMEFFVDESCGYCAPCRTGNLVLHQIMQRILEGKGSTDDLTLLEELGTSVRRTSRCGLGQTSPNPILTTLASFRELYEARVKGEEDGLRRSFNLEDELSVSTALVGPSLKEGDES